MTENSMEETTSTKPETGQTLAPTACSAPGVELRKWAFEKALSLKQDLDIVADLIYKAAEIEAYITEGKNPRGDFFSCVDAALAEVDHGHISEVSDASKRKTMVVVRKWLKEYDALD